MTRKEERTHCPGKEEIKKDKLIQGREKKERNEKSVVNWTKREEKRRHEKKIWRSERRERSEEKS